MYSVYVLFLCTLSMYSFRYVDNFHSLLVIFLVGDMIGNLVDLKEQHERARSMEEEAMDVAKRTDMERFLNAQVREEKRSEVKRSEECVVCCVLWGMLCFLNAQVRGEK